MMAPCSGDVKHMPLWKRRSDAWREKAWERRRERTRRGNKRQEYCYDDVTDDDLRELRACIELGFGFKEEEGAQQLCATLPALDLYFAVNRQLSASPRSSSSPDVPPDAISWRICSPGEDPEQVKTRLRHWAQAVACSVMQSQ